MESDQSYYRRRAKAELAAAQRAVTVAAKARRESLAETYLRRLAELSAPRPALASAEPKLNWLFD